jgi:formiminoglutamase
MNQIFHLTSRPDESLFFRKNDRNDPRLGEIISANEADYDDAQIVIVGCPQDEGIVRNHGREGARFAPDEIRREFYKLTPFGIKAKMFDIGNTIIQETLEQTHEAHCQVVSQMLRDGKTIISLGGGNDISYADGCAMAEVFGKANWIAINVDAHFDVRADFPRNSGTPYRQLLEEKLLRPDYFYEIGFQPQLASPVYYRYLQNLGAHLVSIDQLRSRGTADVEIREMVRETFIKHSSSLNTFFGFDLDAVRSSEAPGVSAPNPYGLRAGEFLTLVQFASKLVNTKIIEFTEVNPKFDVDNRTAKLVAVAMHKFCMS